MFEKTLDNQNRISLPHDLLDYAHIDSKKVAICYKNESEIVLKDVNNINENEKILAIRNIDSKYRIILPAELRRKFKKFFIYVQNNELILRGVN